MGLFGSQSPKTLSTLQTLGAMFQDFGRNYDGEQGTALQQLQKEKLKRQQYQAMLDSTIGTPQLSKVTVTPQMGATGPGSSPLERQSAYNAPAESYQGGMIGNDPILQKLAPMLANADPEMGMPLLMNTALRQGERQQERGDKVQKPMDPAKKASLGFGPDDVVYEDTLGNPVVINKGESLSPEALRQKIQIAQAGRSSSGGMGSDGLFSMIDTGNGVFGVTRGGGIKPMVGPDGKPLVSYHSDPTLRYDVSAAQSGGKNAGVQAEAWPTVKNTFDQMFSVLDKFDAKEFKDNAGASLGVGGYLPNIPGTNTKFNALLDQLKGQNFMQAYQSLKGGGQITEVEGQKAEQAAGRMSRAQTVSEFYDALKDFRSATYRAFQVSRTRATRGMVVPQMGGYGTGVAPGTAPADPLGLR